MELGCEYVHVFAVHSLLVNIICNELTGKVLSRAGPAVQRQNQGLLWTVIVHEAVHGLQDDAGRDVLSKQLAVQVGLQTWRGSNREKKSGE